MLTTVVVVVAKCDLSLGVLSGVLLSGIFFAGKVQRMFSVQRLVSPDGTEATNRVEGEVFFASVDRFTRPFHAEDSATRVVIDVTAAHFWDISGVGALDRIVARLLREERGFEVVGYNRASAYLIDRFARHDRTGVEMGLTPH